MKIIKNAAQCKKCNTIIESKHRNDFVRCFCGAIFVDGGKDYFRAGGKQEDFIPLYEVKEEEKV